MKTTFLPIAYFQGQYLPFATAKISIATGALHYGTAAFGGLRAFVQTKNGKKFATLFRLSEHCQRLSQSAKFLGFEITTDQIREQILEFVRQNLEKVDNSFYIRPLVYVSDLGISPRLHETSFDFLIYGLTLGNYLSKDGVKVCFSSWMRQSDASFPMRGKISGGYITSALAKSEAVARGFEEAILLNSSGKVCEGTGMNLFLVREMNGEQVLITPSVDQDILEGITRKSTIQIAQNLGVKVVERPIDKSELLVAKEVFLTGTAAQLTPVNQIENYSLPIEKPVFAQILAIYEKIIEQNYLGESQYQGWITTITS